MSPRCILLFSLIPYHLRGQSDHSECLKSLNLNNFLDYIPQMTQNFYLAVLNRPFAIGSSVLAASSLPALEIRLPSPCESDYSFLKVLTSQ